MKYTTLVFFIIVHYNLLGQKKFQVQGESKVFNNKTFYVDAIPLSYGVDHSLYPTDKIQSTIFTIKEHRFSFDLPVYDLPYMMMIYSLSEDPEEAMQSDLMDFFFVEKGAFNMTIYNDSVAVNSPLNATYKQLKNKLSLIDTTTTSGKEDRRHHLEGLISENHTSLMALWFLITEYTFSGDEAYTLKILDLFSNNIKATTTFKIFKNDLESIWTKTLASSISTPFPEIPNFPLDLKSTFKKSNYTLIHFWASWCGPCLRNLPKLTETYEQIGNDSLQIIGINTSDDYQKFNNTLEKYKIKWNNFLDSDKAFEKHILIRGIPKYILVNQKGIIQYDGSDFDAALNIVKSGILKK